jgi:branched-chain amino acid transport system permease protein
MADLADELAPALSLGHRRLLEVGRALVRESGVILLDEAASGLDESDIHVLASGLRFLKDEGATVVLVEHNFPLVVELADHIYVLDFGQLIAAGSARDIQGDPRVISCYLGEAAASAAGSPPGPTIADLAPGEPK